MNHCIFNSKLRAFAICCLFLIIGCTGSGFSKNPSQKNQKRDFDLPVALIGPTWHLDRYWFESGWVNNFEIERINIVFLENQHINGFSGCNAFSAGYKIKEKKLLIQSILKTKKHCQSSGNIAMHAEGVFLRLLENVAFYLIDQNTLKLMDNTHKQLLIFKRK